MIVVITAIQTERHAGELARTAPASYDRSVDGAEVALEDAELDRLMAGVIPLEPAPPSAGPGWAAGAG